MGAVCGTDIYSKLLKEYGQPFVQLIMAEKAKAAVNTQVGQFRASLDGVFHEFTNGANGQVNEKRNMIQAEFDKAKGEINSRIPGGLSLIEQAKGQKIEQLLGFNDIMARVEGVKNQTLGMIQSKHMEATNYINNTSSAALAQIDQTKPNIPMFSKLPESLQKVVLDKGEQEFKRDIESNNSKILGALSQQLNLSQFQSSLGGINPGNALNSLVQMAIGTFGKSLMGLLGGGGAGGVGGVVNGLGNMMGGMGGMGGLGGLGGSIGTMGQQALNGITRGYQG